MRNGTPQHDATAPGEGRQRRLERLAANVVEELIDCVGSVGLQLRTQIAALVIDCSVEPELHDQPADFSCSPAKTSAPKWATQNSPDRQLKRQAHRASDHTARNINGCSPFR
jgi:hypothetical protein